MNNFIPQISLTQLAAMLVEDKLVGGAIKDFPIDLSGFKPNQTMFMQIVVENDLLSSKSPINAQVLAENGQEIPVKISLDKALVLPQNSEGKAELKIVSNVGNEIKFKLLSVDGKSSENFVVSEKNILPQSENKTLNVKIDNTPIIKNLSNIQDKSEVVSTVKLDKVLEVVKTQIAETSKTSQVSQSSSKIASDISKFIASETLKTLSKELTGLELKFSVKEVLPSEAQIKAAGTESKLELIQRAISLIEKSIPKLSMFTEGKADVSKSILLSMPQIKEELAALKDVPILARVDKVFENNNFVLKTSLGDLLLKSDLKLVQGKEILLNLSDVVYTKNETALQKNPADIVLKLVSPKFESIIASKLPNFTQPKAITNLVSYVKAVAQQDLKIWLGNEVVEKLSRGGVEGRETLTNLSNLASSHLKETPNWRFVEAPFMLDENFSKFKVAIKKNKEQESKRKNQAKSGTRFIVDTEFSMLGAIQFDGYTLKKDRRFDLIMRTEKEFVEDVYSNIVKLFKITLNELEYLGNIKVNAKESFVKINEDETVFYEGFYI
ncbi:MAG: hypothetical protein ACK5N8_08400 [Alphaproteobacteria bacterium]